MARPSKTRNASQASRIYNHRVLLPRESGFNKGNASPWLSTVMSNVNDGSLLYETHAKRVAQPSPPLTPQRRDLRLSPPLAAQNSAGSAGLQDKAKTSTPSTRIPKHSGKKTTITATNPTMGTRSDDMSNVISTMPQQQEYSYPPLEEMGMQDPVQPYNLSEHRPFSHMVADDRSYEPDQQHQHQHPLLRYRRPT